MKGRLGMIKLVLLDIDGVLTDGKVTFDSQGRELKTVDFKDIDAVFEMRRRGLKVGLLTGEATPITMFFKEHFKPDYFYNACKDKAKALAEIIEHSGLSPDQVCYVGDGKYDIAVMRLLKHSACPANAIAEVRELASIRLQSRGGDGCVWELLEKIKPPPGERDSFNCRACGALNPRKAVLHYPGQPANAQYLPTLESLSQDQPFDLSVFQCQSCALVQLDAAPVPYFREVIRASALSPEMRVFRGRQFAEFVSKHDLVGKKVLECGCGGGEFLDIMKNCGVELHGMEFGLENFRKAQDKGHSLERLFFAEGNEKLQAAPFAAFYSLNVLEHVPDLRTYLRGIRGNLAPGAVGLLEVPNFDTLLENGTFAEFMRDHLYYFTAKSLSLLLENNGFELISVEKVFHDYILSMQVRLREPADFSVFGKTQRALLQQLAGLLEQYGAANTVIWGASHQTFALLAAAGLHKKIKCIIDSAPFKQGRFSPATHIPIVAPDSVEGDDIGLLIAAAGGYSQEVARIARKKFGESLPIYILRQKQFCKFP